MTPAMMALCEERLLNSRKFIGMLATISCRGALVVSRIVRHVRNGADKMSMRQRTNLSPTIRTDKNGSVSSDIGPGGYRGGFAQLLDLTAPAYLPQPLPPQETTRAGFARTGNALSGALAKARERFGG
jgi:hypothetical protein